MRAFQKRKTCKRLNYPNNIHAITFSCFNNLPLLESERTCLKLADAIIRAGKKHDFRTVAYVFMPTHVHLVLLPKNSVYSVSEFLKSVKQSVARSELNFLRKYDPGRLRNLEVDWRHTKYLFWQRGGGYDRNIIEPETLIKTIDYIHANPVRKELVEKPTDWKWSSALDWINNGSGPIPVCKNVF